METTAQTYNYRMGVGEVVNLLSAGGFYKILRATGSLSVSREGGSEIALVLPGQGERTDFQRLTFRNTSGAINNISVLIADDTFVDTRVYGTVEFVDGQAVRTKANNAYSCGLNLAGLAANASHFQLWNPVGSGINCFVTELAMAGYSAGSAWQIRKNTAPLSTPASGVISKDMSAANHPTLLAFSQQDPTLLGNNATGGRFTTGASQSFVHRPTDPYMVRPGNGLILVNSTLGGDNVSNIQFYTEAIET